MAEVHVLRVRMLGDMTGTRNGRPWPKRGEETELEAGEALQLLNMGVAEPVGWDAPEVESAAQDTKPRKRSSGLTKGSTGL